MTAAKQKFANNEALIAAVLFQQIVADVVERIDICGSVRRLVPEVSDIEIVCQPKFGSQTSSVNLFGEEETLRVSLLDDRLNEMTQMGLADWNFDAATGKPKHGERYRRLLFKGIPLDLFIVDPERQHYGAIQAIRTGPADFIRLCVTSTLHGGAMPPHMRQLQGNLELLCEIDEDGTQHWERVEGIDSEGDWLGAIGVPKWAPEDRSERLLQEFLRKEKGARQWST